MYGLEYGYKFLYVGTSGTETPQTATMTGTGSVALTLQINKVFAPAGSGTSTLVKQASKVLNSLGTGTSAVLKGVGKYTTYSGIGTVVAAASKVAYVTATMTGVGAATLAKHTNKFLAYAGTGTATFSRLITKLVAFTMTGVGTASTTVKDITKSFTSSGTGTSVLEATKVILQAMNFTGSGAAVMTYTRNILQSMSFSGIGTSSIIKAISTSYTHAASGAASITKETSKNNLGSTGAGTVTEFSANLTLTEQFATMIGIGAATLVKQVRKVFGLSGTGTASTPVKDTSKSVDISGAGTPQGEQDWNTSQQASMTGTGTLAAIQQFFEATGFTPMIRRAMHTFLRRR